MIHRIGKSFGYELDESAIANFVACLGASVGGKLAASLLPFLKAPIAAGVTYAVGMTAKEYFAAGMNVGPTVLRHKFRSVRRGRQGTQVVVAQSVRSKAPVSVNAGTGASHGGFAGVGAHVGGFWGLRRNIPNTALLFAQPC